MQNFISIRHKSTIGKWLDTVGWFVFVLWVFANFLFDPFPEGVGTLGVGILVWVIAVLRYIFGGTISTYWLIIGFFFVLAGIGYLVRLDLPFLPIALIACGILMLTHRKSGRH